MMKLDSRKQSALNQLQNQLAYRFQRIEWLLQALTHRSYSSQNNERLEFIGDSILDYTIAKMLYEAFPKLPEGKLSQLRALLVKEATLAQMAIELNVGQALFLGVGELKSGGHNRPSILADALEAIFAAISFDADFYAAENVVRHLFDERVKRINLDSQIKDAKTCLQEMLQAQRLALPKYRIEQQTGEGNEAQFDVSCDLGELGYISYAQGASRRVAEQAAAQQALAWLTKHLSHQKNK